MTDKLQIRSEEYDIDIDKREDGGIAFFVEDAEQDWVLLDLKKEHAVKMINHLIKVFDVSRDEVNL